MGSWKRLSDESAARMWDEALLRFGYFSAFQSYAWGEYRRALGWEPCHWAAFNERGEIIAMMLGLVRRYPLGIGLVWCEGGPIGDLSVCDDSLQEAIRQTTGLRRIYCRFRSDRERRIEDALRLSAQGWSRSWFNLTCNYTMVLDLAHGEDQVLAACHPKWRRDLRRASKGSLSVRQCFNPAADEVVSVFSSMQNTKGLEEQYSRDEIENLLKHFKQHLVVYRCDDEFGELVSLSGWIVLGERAWQFLSATSERGRQLNASRAVFWALVQHCLKNGVVSCDLGGIDPVQNYGVYHFKQGTGAVPVEYLGEWDRASSPWLNWLGNWAIARRSRISQVETALKRASATEPTESSEPTHAAQPRKQEFAGARLQGTSGL